MSDSQHAAAVRYSKLTRQAAGLAYQASLGNITTEDFEGRMERLRRQIEEARRQAGHEHQEIDTGAPGEMARALFGGPDDSPKP